MSVSAKKTSELRRGFTTGTCAAAGALAAAQALFGACKTADIKAVDVRLPRGGSLKIRIKSVEVSGNTASATVVKDAGDDPDVTNGAEIVTGLILVRKGLKRARVEVRGGQGVGVVTKPGLKVPPGRPAINPVPLKMIKSAVLEAACEASITPSVVVTVSVPRGRVLALKTMNARLGIIGGISILGTTGIVEPMSLAAYTHSISLGIDVAVAGGSDEVVFSTGRSSEKAVEKSLKLPEAAFILTGDHMGFALKDAAGKEGLKRATVAGQFGKFTKLAAGHFETHCSDSEVEFDFIASLCRTAGAKEDIIKRVLRANTAREVFFILKEEGLTKVFKDVTKAVRENALKLIDHKIDVRIILVGYDGEIVCETKP